MCRLIELHIFIEYLKWTKTWAFYSDYEDRFYILWYRNYLPNNPYLRSFFYNFFLFTISIIFVFHIMSQTHLRLNGSWYSSSQFPMRIQVHFSQTSHYLQSQQIIKLITSWQVVFLNLSCFSFSLFSKVYDEFICTVT